MHSRSHAPGTDAAEIDDAAPNPPSNKSSRRERMCKRRFWGFRRRAQHMLPPYYGNPCASRARTGSIRARTGVFDSSVRARVLPVRARILCKSSVRARVASVRARVRPHRRGLEKLSVRARMISRSASVCERAQTLLSVRARIYPCANGYIRARTDTPVRERILPRYLANFWRYISLSRARRG